ncbi:glycoside hydrolase family 15 protein [Jonesia quinghaiensis]|uniref:glycoside hydrolase family 15 protein n=1 Tax=Jonesia quinghaiensis TaxID=262806 RepID=UPI00048DE205|nr:glycoside hydrolase family 15 protein [Jonesia quinghaiensis]
MGDHRHPRSTPLEDYALLSDLKTGPLVSRDGSIDWLCLPRFDSPAVFSALLGEPEDGRWKLSIDDATVTHRQYHHDTFVLETYWESDTGRALVTDFLPTDTATNSLVRHVTCLEGTITLSHDLRIRFDYNRAKPWTRTVTCPDDTQALLSVAGPDALLLTGPAMRIDDTWQALHHDTAPTTNTEADCDKLVDYHGAIADRLALNLTLNEGETQGWTLTYLPSHYALPVTPAPEDAKKDTITFWHDWAAHVDAEDTYDEAVMRSLLVLRALTDQETGGIVAAPTTSLPEEFGGSRNWDYRYTWLRDAALTIEVLIAHNFAQGALHWRNWLLRAVAGDPDDTQIMYGIAGERHLPEEELHHLAGYEASRPVRIGNGAVNQYQADVVGEVMLALAALRDAGVEEDEYSWTLQRNLLTFAEHNFDRADHGIWEMRGPEDWFTHGRAMMFAAFDQGVRAIEQHGLPGPFEQWRTLRDQLRDEVLSRGFNAELGAFTQTYNNTEVDASLLHLPVTGVVSADDERMLGTVRKIEQDLLDEAGFVHRYRTDSGIDGLEGEEYSFMICSFWLVEQYAHSGRLSDAENLLNRLAECASDLGLFSEEYDSTSKRLAGNFPQAFSHIGFVRAVDAVARQKAQATDKPVHT